MTVCTNSPHKCGSGSLELGADKYINDNILLFQKEAGKLFMYFQIMIQFITQQFFCKLDNDCTLIKKLTKKLLAINKIT